MCLLVDDKTEFQKFGSSVQKRTFTVAFRGSRWRSELQQIRWLARPVLSGRLSAGLHSFDVWAGNRKQSIQPRDTFESDCESLIAAPLRFQCFRLLAVRRAVRLSSIYAMPRAKSLSAFGQWMISVSRAWVKFYRVKTKMPFSSADGMSTLTCSTVIALRAYIEAPSCGFAISIPRASHETK